MPNNLILPEDFNPRYAKTRIDRNLTDLASVSVCLEPIASTLERKAAISYGIRHNPFGEFESKRKI